MPLLQVRAAIGVFAILLTFSPSFAADKKSPPAFLTPESAGPAYALQGEYQGWQRTLGSDRTSRSIGLQVMALGNDEFAATKYYGGLPGNGWYGGERFEYHGKLAGDLVRLSSADYVIEVDGEQGTIFTTDGRRTGTLTKVKRTSPTLAAEPPPGAIILFDGTPTSHFENAQVTSQGWLEAGTQTSTAFGSFRLHAEFMLPFKPLGRGQDRGNSGFYLQSRYEVQVLDSFGLEGVENECGALYKTRRPDINMCFPPLSWQTYDIDFTMPRFDDKGNKTADMRISVWHNGIPIHQNARIPHKTGGGSQEAPVPLPTKLQDHGNPVLYRNIWLVPKEEGKPLAAHWVDLPLHGPPTPIQVYRPAGYIQINPVGVISLGPGCP